MDALTPPAPGRDTVARNAPFRCAISNRNFTNEYAPDQQMVSTAHPEYVRDGRNRAPAPVYPCEELSTHVCLETYTHVTCGVSCSAAVGAVVCAGMRVRVLVTLGDTVMWKLDGGMESGKLAKPHIKKAIIAMERHSTPLSNYKMT